MNRSDPTCQCWQINRNDPTRQCWQINRTDGAWKYLCLLFSFTFLKCSYFIIGSIISHQSPLSLSLFFFLPLSPSLFLSVSVCLSPPSLYVSIFLSLSFSLPLSVAVLSLLVCLSMPSFSSSQSKPVC